MSGPQKYNIGAPKIQRRSSRKCRKGAPGNAEKELQKYIVGAYSSFPFYVSYISVTVLRMILRRKEVKPMTLEELNTALYEKVYAEQEAFIKELQHSTPELVIEQAYELIIREDIVLSLEENDLTAAQCKALLREKKPLDKLFQAWENSESRHMEDIRDCIENLADKLIGQHRRSREASR